MKALVLAVVLGSLGVGHANVIDAEHKEITLKVVYYGPGQLEGNLAHVYKKTNPDSRGKIISLAPGHPKAETYTFLPLSLGEIRGWKTHFNLYTVPVAPSFVDARKDLLEGVDGVVFVANADDVAASKASYAELTKLLAGRDDVPIVFEITGRAKPDAVEKALPIGTRPVFLANVATGTGVFDTLKAIAKLTLMALRDQEAKPADARPLVHAPTR